MFESFLEQPTFARRVLAMPTGALAAPGLVLGAAGVALRAWVRWRLAHRPADAFIDFEGAFASALAGFSRRGARARRRDAGRERPRAVGDAAPASAQDFATRCREASGYARAVKLLVVVLIAGVVAGGPVARAGDQAVHETGGGRDVVVGAGFGVIDDLGTVR